MSDLEQTRTQLDGWIEKTSNLQDTLDQRLETLREQQRTLDMTDPDDKEAIAAVSRAIGAMTGEPESDQTGTDSPQAKPTTASQAWSQHFAAQAEAEAQRQAEPLPTQQDHAAAKARAVKAAAEILNRSAGVE